MYEVNIPLTTPANVNELVEIKWDDSVFWYSRNLRRLVQDGEIVQPLPPSPNNPKAENVMQTSLVDYPSSSDDEGEDQDHGRAQEAAEGDVERDHGRTQEAAEGDEEQEEEDEGDDVSVVDTCTESDDSDADDEDTIVVDPKTLVQAEKWSYFHQGWKKEFRKRQSGSLAGRVETYLTPPNSKRVFRSYTDLRRWIESQAGKRLPFQYDWNKINFDKAGSNTKAKKAFLEFAQQFAQDYDNSPNVLNLAKSLPHFYYQDKATVQVSSNAAQVVI